jgi:2-polyprenyl-3-methyl-5-hydroxy-6-metoxy-1,4-benzoquinol methylase
VSEATTTLREADIRPDALMDEQARCYAADVAWLVERREGFVPVACPACDGARAQRAWEKFGLLYERCTDCETVYLSPRPAPDLLAEYYATSKNYEYWNRVVFPASEDARREKVFVPRAGRIVEIARRHGSSMRTLVDVGAGFGTFCEEVVRIGAFERTIALEPEPHLAQTCRAKGLEVVQAPVEHAKVPVEEVDVIANFEVIEHLFSPRDFLLRCADLLVPGGLFVVTCPNVKGFDIVVLGADANAVDTEHLNYFHPASLSELLGDTGFEVLETQTPGKLDAELVRKKALAGEFDLSGQPFLEQLMLERWETAGGPFQAFLQDSGLSSNMWLVARKR